MSELSLTIRAENLEKVRSALDRLSSRQAHEAYANAIEDTAKQARRRMQDEMKKVFDRPTPWMLKSVSYKADRERLQARILPTYFGGQPVDPQNVLEAQAFGGRRKLKRAEVLLRNLGYLPDGWVTVPGQGARLDKYGNMSGGQIVQILSQLRAQGVAGFTRNMAHGRRGANAQQRAGGRFFVIPPGQRIHPGVYQREFMGRGITPVLMFVSRAQYQVRFDVAKLSQDATLQDYLDKRIRYRVRQLAEGL